MKYSNNEITGDSLVSKSSNQDKYAEGWELIFGKKKKITFDKNEEPKSYSKPIILSNKIQCNKCKDIIESKHRHDFVWCQCQSVACDGGKDYLKRVGNPFDYIDLSEITSEDKYAL